MIDWRAVEWVVLGTMGAAALVATGVAASTWRALTRYLRPPWDKEVQITYRWTPLDRDDSKGVM